MSVPLRKDEFDEEKLTTADLAQGKRPATGDQRGTTLLKDDRSNEDRTNEGRAKDDRPRPVLAERPAVENAETGGRGNVSGVRNNAVPANAAETTPLFPNNELEDLRNRWSAVQTAFVDEPRRAVEQADGLVASAMKRIAEVFAEERSKLEKQWDRGDNVSTEDLRVALQRYRSFFNRLLSV